MSTFNFNWLIWMKILRIIDRKLFSLDSFPPPTPRVLDGPNNQGGLGLSEPWYNFSNVTVTLKNFVMGCICLKKNHEKRAA